MVTPEKVGNVIDELQIKLKGLNIPYNKLYFIITDLNVNDVKKEYLHSYGNLTCIYQRLNEIKIILSHGCCSVAKCNVFIRELTCGFNERTWERGNFLNTKTKATAYFFLVMIRPDRYVIH